LGFNRKKKALPHGGEHFGADKKKDHVCSRSPLSKDALTARRHSVDVSKKPTRYTRN